jgi:histidine triad (HIT) family protein
MNDCLFCRIARKEIASVIVHEDAELLAFLDNDPIRAGHTQVVPKSHFDYFENLPPELAGKILALGQQLAQRMKTVYRVDRVGFAFTGGDVAHAHAHVVPLHEKTDITSARYWRDGHHLVDEVELARVRDELGFVWRAT